MKKEKLKNLSFCYLIIAYFANFFSGKKAETPNDAPIKMKTTPEMVPKAPERQ